MKSQKFLRELCSRLRKTECSFSVKQNRHIKIDVFNHKTAQTAMLILSTTPSDINSEKASIKQCRKNLEKVGVHLSPTKKET